jgi:hypothetical protein
MSTLDHGCVSGKDVAVTVLSLAFGLFVSTLWSGYAFQGSPLVDLGKRPLGTGLWSYLFEYYRQGQAVWGYDPILGAFAPPLRLRFHGVALLVLYALMVAVIWPRMPWHSSTTTTDNTTTANTQWCSHEDNDVSTSVLDLMHASIVTFFLYLSWQYLVHHLLPAVSYPGPARDHKIQRIPQWKNCDTKLPSFALDSWRCVVAEESHDVSRQRFQGTSAQITGEPSGRQMWTNSQPSSSFSTTTTSTTTNSNNNTDHEENLIQQLAAGGRDSTGKPGTFNPAKNPNR